MVSKLARILFDFEKRPGKAEANIQYAYWRVPVSTFGVRWLYPMRRTKARDPVNGHRAQPGRWR